MPKVMPFDFLLEELSGLDIHIKQMFGCHALYDGNRILIILRDRESSPKDNGIWVAVNSGHHESMKKDYPSLRDIEMFGPGPTGWQVLPKDSDNFESECIRLCQLLCDRDPRVGKIPKSRMKKKTMKKKKS